MPSVTPLSARRLDRLLSTIALQPTIGLDLLREITSQLREVAGVTDTAARTVVAWTLVERMQSLCEKYDAEPMTVKESGEIAQFVRGPVRDALRFLGNHSALSDSRAIELMARLIEQK